MEKLINGELRMQADKRLDETRNKTRNKSYTGLALSLILTLFKLLAGILGNSTLLLADAVRSFSEFINDCIKLLDFSIGSKPGDESHNYGHDSNGDELQPLDITAVEQFAVSLKKKVSAFAVSSYFSTRNPEHVTFRL